MRNVQFKKEINFIRYWLTIVFGVSIVFLVDSLLFAHSSSDVVFVNTRQFFGVLGDNLTAIGITTVLIIFYAVFAYKTKLFFSAWFVLVGALSNFTGRFCLGGVPDYIKISYVPTFNIADTLIVFGLILNVYFYIKKSPLQWG